jgi:hypothetical protein
MSEKTKTTWVINGLLAAILVLLVGVYFSQSSVPAYAAGGGWDTDGIIATSFDTTDRLVLIDTKNKAIMIYRVNGNMFRLAGARSFEFDTEVEDSGEPGVPIEKGQGMTWLQMYHMYNESKKRP